MYLESIITYRLRGTAKLVGLLPDRWRANHPEAIREYREQERRDKADVASVQAAKRRAVVQEEMVPFSYPHNREKGIIRGYRWKLYTKEINLSKTIIRRLPFF